MLSGYAKQSRVQVAVDMITGPLLLGGVISLVSRRAPFRGRGLGETAHCFLGTATPEKARGLLGSLAVSPFSSFLCIPWKSSSTVFKKGVLDL